MEYLCTICCKEKRVDHALLPALDRYISERIQFVYQESYRLSIPMVILSGKYGLLAPNDLIPWYDQKLTVDAIVDILPTVVAQIRRNHVTKVVFYCHPETDKDWLPYHELLKQSCSALNVEIVSKYIMEE